MTANNMSGLQAIEPTADREYLSDRETQHAVFIMTSVSQLANPLRTGSAMTHHSPATRRNAWNTAQSTPSTVIAVIGKRRTATAKELAASTRCPAKNNVIESTSA